MKINLASTRLAFVLIAVLAALILISAIVPQQDIADDQIVDWRELLRSGYVVIEKLRLDRMYTSPIFIATIVLLCVSLVAGNVRRFQRMRQIRSTRGRIRVLGSIAFHFSLLVVLLGATLNHLYKSRVIFGLTEGQRVTDRPSAYFRDFSGPLCREAPDRFAITLKEIHTSWPVGDLTTEAALVKIDGANGGGSTTDVIHVNHPLRRDGVEFHLGAQIGYSPELVVETGEGNHLFRSFVRLSRRQEHGELVDADLAFLPGDNETVEMRMTDGGASPLTLVSVESNGHEVYAGYPGEIGADLADGRRVSVPRLRRWCYVEAVRNPFMYLVFTGFWAALGSLVVTAIPRIMPTKRRSS